MYTQILSNYPRHLNRNINLGHQGKSSVAILQAKKKQRKEGKMKEEKKKKEEET